MLRNPLIRSLASKRRRSQSLLGSLRLLSSSSNTIKNTTTDESTTLPPLHSPFQTSTDYRDWFPSLYDSQKFDHFPPQAKFVVRLLQDLYLTGGPQGGADRVTTARCNQIMNNLNAKQADQLLQAMQAFELWSTDTQPTHKRLPMELPRPDRATYTRVLHLYAHSGNPHRCLELVSHMHFLYRDHGQLDLKPDAMHYNSCILAWKEEAHPQRALYAYQILQRALVEKGDDHLDFLYVNVLRLAALDKVDHVATSVWKLRKPGWPSHVYAHVLQAVRESPQRVDLFREVLQVAIEQGKVNRIVLNEFLVHVQDRAVFEEILGAYKEQIYGLSRAKALETLMELIPAEWTKNADPVTSDRDERGTG